MRERTVSPKDEILYAYMRRALEEVLGGEPEYLDTINVEYSPCVPGMMIISCNELTIRGKPGRQYATSITLNFQDFNQGRHIKDAKVLVKHTDGTPPTGLAHGFGMTTHFVTSLTTRTDAPDARLLSLYRTLAPHAA